ncbi:MAG: phospho-N-acetylmuramoyl-pentapeptide-transferase [Holosporales bacterium]|jgi:phospho-N-acetylmuramoyl-pentapeptide-transferase|nr:phospho-N-acetylmuramoyl-pentapeptide-transferase [Holosporales bacterium]
MLLWIFSVFCAKTPNILRYITFRTSAALVTAFLISFFCGPAFIRSVKRLQKEGQPIRSDNGLDRHFWEKKGTPTMGGALLLIALLASTALWANWHNLAVWLVLGVTVGYGGIGFVDDFLKLARNDPKGLRGTYKLLLQSGIALAAVYGAQGLWPESVASHVAFPFFKNLALDLCWAFPLFAAFVIVGSSNAVNLTDGLDGLAIVPVIIGTACFGLISYLVGHAKFSLYLHIAFVPGVGELCILCGALIGASLGFLWYNAPPAMIFMGDTGSLALGGAIGMTSVLVKHEIVLAIIGGLFVIEAVSVILQVGYFKLTGKRIFLMSPIHHHFEKKGWEEPTIVVRFWIISVMFALAGLSTLKLR